MTTDLLTSAGPAWAARALAVFPAGSNGEFGIPAELIPVLERGEGGRVWDTEGRQFLDYTMAWGSALVGHGHPKIREAVTRALPDGYNFAGIHRRSVELAERLQDLIPCAERVRFVASGTEATMMCLRVAQAATGRPKVLKFEGAYHGQHPVGITSMLNGRPTVLPQSDPSGAGASWVEHDVLVAPFNDLAATERILTQHASEIAAVIVEPLHRCLAPAPGFLEGLRAVTRRLGVVLVFDEVVTGFRFGLGGAQQYYGVTPDLAAFGKALGGGLPLGAYAGKAELMEVVNEHRLPGPNYAWSASTTGGNPVSCAASLAALDLYSEPDCYSRLHSAGRRFRGLLADALATTRTVGQVLGDGPLAQIAFSAQPVTDQRSWLASNRARGRALMLELLRRGVFLNPMGTKLYLSLAHDDRLLQEFGERLVDSLRATAPAV
ncbi:MAG: aminotransferase class III-fold pyridoxal phosphate-dependent enzyme [Verrucomicrobia bacterium]|nr:aminotransferase class III-fold pyridoxal phosphate-dependent enzyme [Verrucomicrobiota bacterium]